MLVFRGCVLYRYQILRIIDWDFPEKYRYLRELSVVSIPFDTAHVTTRNNMEILAVQVFTLAIKDKAKYFLPALLASQ